MRHDRLGSVTLRQLQIFAAVARERSFVKAASALYLAEGTVSEQIKETERRIGLRLLERSRGRGGLEVTEAGQIVLRTCREVFEALDRGGTAVEMIRGHIRGSLVLGTGMTFCGYVLPIIYDAFQRVHPGIALHVESAMRPRLLDGLRRGDLDLAVVLGQVGDANLVSEVLGECELVLVGPPGHRLASGPAVPFRELGGERFILDDQSVTVRQVVERLAAEAKIRLDVALELSNDDGQRESAMRGIGLTVLSAFSVRQSVADGKLCLLQVEGFPQRLPWVLVHLPTPLSPAAEAFKQHLLEYRGKLESLRGPGGG